MAHTGVRHGITVEVVQCDGCAYSHGLHSSFPHSTAPPGPTRLPTRGSGSLHTLLWLAWDPYGGAGWTLPPVPRRERGGGPRSRWPRSFGLPSGAHKSCSGGHLAVGETWVRAGPSPMQTTLLWFGCLVRYRPTGTERGPMGIGELEWRRLNRWKSPPAPPGSGFVMAWRMEEVGTDTLATLLSRPACGKVIPGGGVAQTEARTTGAQGRHCWRGDLGVAGLQLARLFWYLKGLKSSAPNASLLPIKLGSRFSWISGISPSSPT